MQTLWYILLGRRLRRYGSTHPWVGRVADRFALWALVVGCSVAAGGLVLTTLLSGR